MPCDLSSLLYLTYSFAYLYILQMCKICVWASSHVVDLPLRYINVMTCQRWDDVVSIEIVVKS